VGCLGVGPGLSPMWVGVGLFMVVVVAAFGGDVQPSEGFRKMASNMLMETLRGCC